MTRSERMEPIKSLADDREREAARRMEVARRALDDAERQLVQLRQYRAEYAERITQSGAPDVVRLQNYQAFLSRLGDAITQQEQVVKEALRALAGATEGWQEKRIEAASLGRAVDKIAIGERMVADRRAQRESDERALQQTMRARSVDF